MISSYYSTKTSPWAHGNVTVVKDALTSADALKAAGLDFNVLQEPVFTVQGNALAGYRLNRKSDDGTVLGLVSPRYKIVQNTDAFAFVDGLIGPGCRYENAGSANDFSLTWLQVKLRPRTIMGDLYDNYLFFKNSFDGKGAVKVCVTPVRIACDNMLNLAVHRAKRVFSIRHTGDIAGKIKEADMTLQLSENYLTEVNADYVKLARIKIQKDKVNQLFDSLFPIKEDASDREIGNAVRQRDAVKTAYNADDLANFRGTGFGVVNAVADMVSHAEPLRMTDSYFGNLFDKVTNGHPLLDMVCEMVEAEAK